MLDIESAIRHCEEVADSMKREAERYIDSDGLENDQKDKCIECASDHRQLAEWLRELKELREEKGERINKISGGDVLRICQLEDQLKDWKEEYAYINKVSYSYYKELKDAKRLLKSAANVLKTFIPCDDDYCSECIKQRQNCDYDDSFKWIYADEAEKLIGGRTMTVEQLEQGQRLLQDIKEYERRLQYVERGEIIARYDGGEVYLTEDIFQELLITQIKKDLRFLKERFESL